MELLPNLHWIQGRASNIYLWRHEGSLIMVDTGMPGDARKIITYMADNGMGLAEVEAILVTHADIDHAGGAAELSAACDSLVYASQASAQYLVRGKSPKHLPRAVQFLSDRFFGYRPVSRDKIRFIKDGHALPELENIQALATPGHCADHISYFSPVHGILFAGDALNCRGGAMGLSARRITADQSLAAHSARRLLKLTPAVFACGHGRPFIHHDSDDLMMLFRQLGQLANQNGGSRPPAATGGK
jgi:glyoxylase-like metal-dependent hydrolase (beta-lactamase superfamily II)